MATVRTARFGATTAQSFDTDRDRGAAGPHEIHQPDDQRIDDHRIRDAAQCLIDSLLALGGAWPGDAGARRSLVAAAVTHGELRRGQGHAEEIIFQD